MKQLFVTHTEQPKKKQQRIDLFQLHEKKDQSQIPNSNTSAQSDVLSNSTLISSASSTTTNSSNTESRKISCNFFTSEMTQICVNPNINFNTINTNYNNNNNDKNKFLGKKTKSKVRFDIIKNEEKKPVFFSNSTINNINTINNKNNNNSCANKFNITINTQNILNSPVSNSTEGTLANKDIEKSDSSDTIDFNGNKNDKSDNVLTTFNLFNTKISQDLKDSTTITVNIKRKKDKNGVNEGRWSYEEHIKFIEAIIQYGKNWKSVQKYVGTRTSAQARSHAQKFFLKLKAMKNNKFNYDFSDDNIKSLSDIIDIIKKNNNEREYIISTLIILSDCISINENNNDNDLCRSKSCDINIKEKINKDIQDINNMILLNNKNDDTNNIMNNEIKKDEKIIQNNNNNKVNIDNYAKKPEININKNINKNINFQAPKEEISFINRPRQQRYIWDDGIIYLSDGSEFFCMDNFSLKIKNYLSMKNMKSPYLKFISTFFS